MQRETKWIAAGLGLGAAALGAGEAQAGIEALHVGVNAHNICIQNCDNANKESGANIEAQLDFSSPPILRFVGSPKPYVIGSINTAGDTSYGGAGLEWKLKLGEHWSLDPGLGYIIHNGETELPFPSGTPEAAEFTNKHVLLGSRDLFRLSLNVTHDLPGPWAAQFQIMHMSHGQILGTGRNQGLDEAGLRLVYHFGE